MYIENYTSVWDGSHLDAGMLMWNISITPAAEPTPEPSYASVIVLVLLAVYGSSRLRRESNGVELAPPLAVCRARG
jgi:hypothetical protein